jgi:hypothetical protein
MLAIGGAGICICICIGGGIGGGGGGGIEGATNGATNGAADGAIDGGRDAMEGGIGSGPTGIDGGSDAGMASGALAALGAPAGIGASDAVVTSGFRSSGFAIGSVPFASLAFGGLGAAEGFAGAADATDTARGAIEGGAGGATEGARGAMAAWLARGGIETGLAADTGASADASDIRFVPGATLDGGAGGSKVAPAAARLFASSARASAMSGGIPCAVAASSCPLVVPKGAGAFAAGATPAMVFRPADTGRGTRPLSFRSSDDTAAPIRKLK